MSLDQELVEIVDFEGRFHKEFGAVFERLDLLKCGLRFNVVTVLGCQSSGKSTLLNAMFGTRFPEMDSLAGRGQTTKGIWCSRDASSTSTLVVDVEGTDSKERGEDRVTFEHRASLFSLAIADAVIINMWYHDIGRYTASNYGLLKTVLGVMLELFHASSDMPLPEKEEEKTLMLFIIRDYDPVTCTPLAKLERSLLEDVVNIWSDIKKPLPLKNTQVDDLFRFSVLSLPDKTRDLPRFLEAVGDLRKTWDTKLKPKTYSKKVPADGFPFYAQSVWDSIMSSQQLNIPSQKTMVATYRCDEIKSDAFDLVRPQLERGEEGIEESLRTALRAYHSEAWRYDHDVYLKKRGELINKIFDYLQKSHDQKSNELRQKILKVSVDALKQLVGRQDPFDPSRRTDGTQSIDHWMAFDNVLKTWKNEVLTEFASQSDEHTKIDLQIDLTNQDKDEETTGPRGSGSIEYFEEGDAVVHVKHEFNSELQTELLEEKLEEAIKAIRQQEKDFYLKFLNVDELRVEIENLNLTIDNVSDYWPQATKIFRDFIERTYEAHAKFLPSVLGEEDDSLSTVKDKLSFLVYTQLRELMSLRLDTVAEEVYKRFKKYFEMDENSIPYYWHNLTDERIRAIYVSAREKSLPLLDQLAEYNIDLRDGVLSEGGDDVKLPEAIEYSLAHKELLVPTKKQKALSDAEKYMIKSCQQAQFIQATGATHLTKVAWWMWILVLVLGWNEIMFVIRSPIFSISLITFGLMLLGLWYTGNLFLLIKSGRFFTTTALTYLLPLLQQHAGIAPVSNAPAAPPAPTPTN